MDQKQTCQWLLTGSVLCYLADCQFGELMSMTNCEGQAVPGQTQFTFWKLLFVLGHPLVSVYFLLVTPY